MEYPQILFIAAVIYCVMGNAIAYILISRKGIQTSFFWSGTPGYLYYLCRKSPEIVGKGTRYLALTSSLVFFILILAFFIFGENIL